MFYVETCAHIKSASEDTYTINSESRRECENIMAKIYQENPSFWPEGLHVAGHDDLYMIREASTGKAIGFTGWQQFVKEGGKKVGYYTIGILPEYRQNGFAKEAVRKIIKKKASGVDRVEAYIATHNTPSIGLANRLGVPVVKAASMGKWIAGAGLGNAAAWDYMGQGDKQPWHGEYWEDASRDRLGMAAMNALLGMGGGLLLGKGMHGLSRGTPGAGESIAAGAGTIALSPVKDWLVRSLPAASKLPGLADNLSKPAPAQDSVMSWIKDMSPTAKNIALGAAGLGLAGAAYGGYKGVQALNNLADSNQALAGGRLQVALPSKDKYDHETVVNMPLTDVNVSTNQKMKLIRDVRRRIYRETKERTKHHKKQKDQGKEKAACLLPVESASMSTVTDLLNYIHHAK